MREESVVVKSSHDVRHRGRERVRKNRQAEIIPVCVALVTNTYKSV